MSYIRANIILVYIYTHTQYIQSIHQYNYIIIQLPLPTISLIAKQLIFPSPVDSPFVISQLRASGWESCRKIQSISHRLRLLFHKQFNVLTGSDII